MTLSALKKILALGFAATVLCFLPSLAVAQQVTYYTFDGADAPGNSGYCSDLNAVGYFQEPSNPLLCIQGDEGGQPGFITESCHPGDTRCIYGSGGSGLAVQINPSQGSRRGAIWFSVPQKVTNGFTAYFAFRITPSTDPGNPIPDEEGYYPVTTADGMAFLLQNSYYSEGNTIPVSGSGPNVLGGGGGGIGYNGIDNSLAVEFDTFRNSDIGDPDGDTHPGTGTPGEPANHIALQSCNSDQNTINHAEVGSGGCLIPGTLHNDLTFAVPESEPDSPTRSVTLADGKIHEVVVEYSGDAGEVFGDETLPPHQLRVYVDPVFIEGTHTPTGVAPLIDVSYTIQDHLTLLGSNCSDALNCDGPLDSAYVGFTAATGAAYEEQSILAWTFTPHTPVTQQQPIEDPGTQTTFPYGDHTFGVTYPTDHPDDPNTGIDMIVTANTVDPALFESLLVGTQFQGSQCQIYDGTGGKCVVYSVSCVEHNSDPPNYVACPATQDDSNSIELKTAFENTDQPVAPGFLQGDPFLTPISSITSSGGTATATCAGECSIPLPINPDAPPQVKIIGNSEVGFNDVPITVTSATVDQFTFSSPVIGTGTGGYVNSTNIQNIFVSYDSQRIDGTIKGSAKSFSSFVATSNTVASQPLSFTSGSAATFKVGTAGNFPVSATGLPAPTIGQPTGTLPSGVTFSGGALNGTPQPGTGGVYPLVFTASNGISADVTQPFTLTVQEAPYFTSPSSATFTVGSPVYFPVTAGGYPAPTITKTGGSLPPGIHWDGTALTGTPTASCGSSYAVSFKAVNGVSPNATQTLHITIQLPPGQLTLTPDSLDFGTAKYKSTTKSKVTIKNTGYSTVGINWIGVVLGPNSDADDFTQTNNCPSSLAKGKSCAVTVAFYGDNAGTRSATLKVTDNTPGSPHLVPLTANVINPAASLNKTSVNFGTVTVGTTSAATTIVITSSGQTPLIISSIYLSGSYPTDYVESSNCPISPASLAPTATCNVTVAFKPARSGTRPATLKIVDNAGTQTVSLTGKGR